MPVEPLPCEPTAPGPGPGPDVPDPCCAPSIATVPACLADGTPIGLVLRAACACAEEPDSEPEVAGWVDLASGAYTPGPPPDGTGQCGERSPTPMCAQLLGLSGPETWNMPEGTESVSVAVVCGPVTITDCAGNSTAVNECGTTFQWAAPVTGGGAPPALCTPFTVDVPEGAAVYINLVTPCDTTAA